MTSLVTNRNGNNGGTYQQIKTKLPNSKANKASPPFMRVKLPLLPPPSPSPFQVKSSAIDEEGERVDEQGIGKNNIGLGSAEKKRPISISTSPSPTKLPLLSLSLSKDRFENNLPINHPFNADQELQLVSNILQFEEDSEKNKINLMFEKVVTDLPKEKVRTDSS